jgi:hypothetical protein
VVIQTAIAVALTRRRFCILDVVRMGPLRLRLPLSRMKPPNLVTLYSVMYLTSQSRA